MKKEIVRMQEELQRAFQGSAWHGPSVMELLSDVSAAQAAARPLPAAHSIWELVLHIAAWDLVVARRLSGERVETIPETENFPAVADSSDGAWRQTIETLQANHQNLQQAIGKFDEAKLDEPLMEGMRSAYITIHGAIEHDLYHAGQIALLKKAL